MQSDGDRALNPLAVIVHISGGMCGALVSLLLYFVYLVFRAIR